MSLGPLISTPHLLFPYNQIIIIHIVWIIYHFHFEFFLTQDIIFKNYLIFSIIISSITCHLLSILSCWSMVNKKKKWSVWIPHIGMYWVIIHYPNYVLIITHRSTWLLRLIMLNILPGSSIFLLINMFDWCSWLALQNQFHLPTNYFSKKDSFTISLLQVVWLRLTFTPVTMGRPSVLNSSGL